MHRQYLLSLTTTLLLTIGSIHLVHAETSTIQNAGFINESVVPWTKLKPSNEFANTDGLKFFRLKTDNGSAACLVVLNIKDKRYVVKPFFNTSLNTTSNAACIHNALVAINGGYFNLSNGESTSYIVIDGREQCDPRKNTALVENPQLRPYLETIFNRSEVQIIRNPEGSGADRTWVILSNHNLTLGRCPTPLHKDNSLQAGPRLLPKLTDKEEAFVRTDSSGKLVDSVGSNKPAARTAFGITTDGYAILLCVASKGQDEFSSGVTLTQLADILKRLGCIEAINFDGGTSTTMVIRRAPGSDKDSNGATNPNHQYQQACGRTPEKLVKSGLMILPAKE